MTSNKVIMQPFWLSFWSGVVALGWLLPNHYRPWVSFHADAWIATALLFAAAAVIWRVRGPLALHRIAVLVALLPIVPWLQYGFGLIPQQGVAWISFAYLLGFLLALLIGVQWEAHSPGQMVDGLFLAIGIAGVVSVGLQLQQWLQLDGLELWKMGGGPDRPFANLGQPNQLATLLLWAVLAITWCYLRGFVRPALAVIAIAFLLWGVALTHSRTAWLGIGVSALASWYWRAYWPNRKLPWVVSGLCLYFVVCVWLIGQINVALDLNSTLYQGEFERMGSEPRPQIWAMFLDAALRQPWLGYGWNQVVLAQMAVATEHPHIPGFLIYSHNLFLDLVLWCGIPLGLFLSVAFLVWFWRCFSAVDSAENAILMLFLLMVANHAMLELPLHYGYFLLPVGLVMGALEARIGARPVFLLGRWFLVALWLAATMLLALIIRDYARVATSYEILKFELLRIKITLPVGPPDVLLLTQWRDYIKFARMDPKPSVGEDELAWMRNLTGLFPGGLFFHKFAMVLALNQRPEEAQLWLKRMCKTVPESECRDVQTIWARQSLVYPEIAAIPWPVKAVH